ncbi:hypothetical protein JCM24511_07841, partial [Saitozyma sp. JCM 24511]
TSVVPQASAQTHQYSCDCSDALLKLKVVHGGFLSGPSMWSPKRQEGNTKIVGRAYTVKYALLDDPAPKVANHYIDEIPKGSVIFISSPPNLPNAVYGGLMSNRAKASGAAGTVVDGRIRDLNEHREIGMPVFARDVGTASPYELVKVVGTNVPVKLQSEHQDMTINPGDYIVADLDGVVVIPQELVETVIPLMKRQVEADTKVLRAIRDGMSFTEASEKFRV